VLADTVCCSCPCCCFSSGSLYTLTMEPAGGRRIDQRNTSNLDLLVEANLDFLVDALSLYYCHSLGVRKLESSGKQMAHTQRHRDGSAQNPADPSSPPSLLQSPSVTERKNVVSNIVSIGRRVLLLLAMVLIAATLATMSAASAFADELSDSQLRHKIHVIQNRPGPLTNQEEERIQTLKDRIHDNDDNNEDDEEDDEEDDNDDD
jgi:hypothetical protein